MTHSQRLRLADRYARFLSEGRTEDLIPILSAAENDAALSTLIVAINRGDAEDEGFALAPDERDRIIGRLADLTARAADSAARAPSVASVNERPAKGRPFLVLLKEETGKTMEEAAAEMDGTANLFDDINTYHRNHPDPRVAALRLITIRKANSVHQIPEEVSADGLEYDPGYDLAAYAEGELDRSLPTFEEILEDSGMTPEQQARWTEEAERIVREGGAAL